MLLEPHNDEPAMWKRWLIVLVVTLVVLAGSTAGGVYAYDEAQSGRIAKGVRIGPFDVSNLSEQGARLALRQQLVPLLNRPVQAVYRRRNFTISPTQAGLRIDVSRMVGEAREASRNGNVVSRVYRDVRGRPLDVHVPIRVTYSPRALRAFVRRVAGRVDKAPRDARVVPAFASLTKVRSVDGLAVRKRLFERRLAAQLTSPKSLHGLEVPVRVLKPKVTTRSLERKYPYFITISRTTKQLKLFRNLRPFKTYRIAVGQIGYGTPGGLYRVENKAINPAWHVPNSPWAGKLAGKVIPGNDPTNPIKARWLGVYDGVGIHGTTEDASIGHNASHGCIRMHIPDVEKLYDEVPVGAAIYIA